MDQYINRQAKDASANFQTDAVDLSLYDIITVQVVWSGLSALDSEIVPIGSNNGSDFLTLDNTVGKLTIDTASGTTGWEWPFSFGWRYLAFSYTANTNTTGSLEFVLHAKRSN